MSLLSNTEIRTHVENSEILRASSDGDKHFGPHLLQPASLDITVAEIFLPPEANDAEYKVVKFKDHYTLEVGSTVLVRSEQCLNLSSTMGGFVFPKNGHFALKGILITNFGHIDPGYIGHLKFTVINMGRQPFRLEVGLPVACVVLFDLSSPAIPDWTGQTRHDTDNYESHAKILARNFMDIEARVHQIARDQAKEEWQTRERMTLLATIVTAMIAMASILVPLVYIGYDKIVATNFEMNKLQAQVDTMKAKLEAPKNP